MKSHSEFDERPAALNEPDEPRVWPFGTKVEDGGDRGRLLTSFSSVALLDKRAYLERHNIGGDLDWLIAQIDSVLQERGGEL